MAGETFKNHFFTDEVTIQLERHKRKVFAKKGEKLMALASVAKHPVKLHAWAGISSEGATDICVFDGKTKLNSAGYTRIINEFYCPANEAKFSGGAFLVQDNAPMPGMGVSVSVKTRDSASLGLGCLGLGRLPGLGVSNYFLLRNYFFIPKI